MSVTVDQIIDYESGEMGEADALRMFADLIRTGQCWGLQGSYGRAANHLISSGLITELGQITPAGEDYIAEAEWSETIEDEF